jgi:tRNA(Arg) A34 adenosine deaminase TadA
LTWKVLEKHARDMVDEAISVAYHEALKSVETFKLGAAVIRRKSVLALGRNKNVNSHGLPSIHAEMDACWKLDKNERFRDLHLVVVRATKTGIACSKPCPACLRSMKRFGIRKITYTTGDPDVPLDTLMLKKM